jgi:hypothetical protein
VLFRQTRSGSARFDSVGKLRDDARTGALAVFDMDHIAIDLYVEATTVNASIATSIRVSGGPGSSVCDCAR